MTVKIEEFSLRHIIPQFREFNFATKHNRKNLVPYFWWARTNDFSRFQFIFWGVVVEKLAHVLSGVPYNKKFIIRDDGKFAGIIGLDLMSPGALSSEVWFFVDGAHLNKHVASNALKQIEDYACKTSVQSIRAHTSPMNQNSKHLLSSNDYAADYTERGSIAWRKILGTKVIEK